MAALAAMVPAWLPTAMAVVGGVTSVIGGFQAADAAKTAGERQKTASEFEAAQLQQAAGQSIAASQRDAMEQNRQARLLQSRALALSAASGAGTTDPSVVNLISNIAGEGAYRSSVALYQGEEKARQLNDSAAAAIYQGDVAMETAKNKAKAYRMQGITGAMTGAASLFGKYGAGGPGSPSAVAATGGANLLLDTGITNPMIG